MKLIIVLYEGNCLNPLFPFSQQLLRDDPNGSLSERRLHTLAGFGLKDGESPIVSGAFTAVGFTIHLVFGGSLAEVPTSDSILTDTVVGRRER